MLRFVLLSFTLALCSFSTIAQIDISFPVSRIVFQRDLQNKATVPITGNLLMPCDYIEAKLSPISGFQGTDTGWQKISNSASGIYQGQIQAAGGWYNLEVRAFKNNQIVGQSKLDRVGVGEVFVIAGQSNAEGNSDYEGSTIGVQDDRVNAIDYKDIFMDEAALPFNISKLSDNVRIGPYNPTPWLWAVMAERIVKQYGVPVLLFGAAVGGTASDVWFRSARGEDLTPTNSVQVKFPGSPYQVLSRTLRNYAARTGVRAILWQQGESDFNNSESNYYNNVKYVIDQTRKDMDQPLAWIMAESSRTPNISFSVTSAQKKLIANDENVFPGPNTDLIVGPENRADGIHFHKNGIKLAGNAWFEAIHTNSLFSKISPIEGIGQVNLQLNCSGNQEDVEIVITNNNIQSFWNNGSSTNKAIINSGAIDARVYNSKGLRLNFPRLIIQPKNNISPSISLIGEKEFCEGSSVKLVANNAKEVLWQNGSRQNEIFPSNTDSYFFQAKNIYGCNFESDKVDIQVYPKPVPSLNITNGIKRICEGESFTAKLTNSFSQYQWSDGSNADELVISNTGNYSVQVFSENNCPSDIVNFEIEKLNRPEAPVIEKVGFFAIQSTYDLTPQDQLNWYLNQNLLSSGTKNYKVSTSGVYSSKLAKTYQFENETLTCLSDFSNQIIMEIGNQKIAAYPNPSQGSISVETIEPESNVELKLYTYTGQLIATRKATTQDLSLNFDFPEVANGTYILSIRSGSFRYSKPFILLR